MSELSRDGIVAAVRSLAEGNGATTDGIVAQVDLMTLRCVVAEATEYGRKAQTLDMVAGVMQLFLEEAADSLEEHPYAGTQPNRATAARVALGLEKGTQGKPLRGNKGKGGRVADLALWLGYKEGSLFHKRVDGSSIFGDLINDIAAHLVRRETTHRVEEQRLAQRAHRPPLESAMRIDWLARFEFYYKMWATISGLRHDLELGLGHLSKGETTDTELFTRKSLYYYANYLTQLRRFQTEYGGLWILPNTKTEDAIADSTWFIRKPMPLGEVDDSMLRLTFTRHPELALFMHATFVEPYLQPIVRSWRNWIHTCKCASPKRPRKDCKVHETITWAAFYMEGLDKQWDFLADWYTLPRPGTRVDPLKLANGPLPAPPDSQLTG